MLQYQMLEKGQTNIDLTTNVINSTNEVKIYKIYEDDTLKILDITESDPNITSIADDALLRYTFDTPNEDCYILTLFNGYPRFFRVGVPTMRIFSYFETTGLSVAYKLLNFDGSTDSEGNMDELDLGVYYVTPSDVGDYIFTCSKYAPIPVHTPYVVDSTGMSGKILFQKDKWMMIAVPLDNKKISDVVADIENTYGVSGDDIFRIFSAYPATGTQSSEMLDFKPGVTPLDTKYNFNLVYSDGDIKEITGFWCKTKNYDLEALNAGDADELVTYSWHA